MIRIAICDDEKYYREQIKCVLMRYLVKSHIDYHIDMFSSGEKFIEQFSNLTKYDIAFLDVNMIGVGGIDVAYLLRKYQRDIFIVFVTAYINYAIDGYKVDAIRYIMKDDLVISIPECMDAILKKMKIQMHKIEFSFISGKKQVLVEKIFYIESQKHKLTFNVFETGIERYEIYNKLDNIEADLKEYGFLRIHKSYLVNMRYINQINSYKAVLISNDELPIPKLKYQEVKEAFIMFKGEL